MNRWTLALAGFTLIAGAACSGDSPSGVDTPPLLTAVSPATGVQGTTEVVTLTGSHFIVHGSSAFGVSGSGITVNNLNVTSSTSATVNVTISADAPLGVRTLTLATTAGQASAAPTFTILPPPPTLSALSSAAVAEGATVTETLTGTNFVAGATAVGVSGTGVSASNVSVTNATTLTVSLAVDSLAAIGARQITVTTPGGVSAAQPLTVNPPLPTISGVNPNSGTTGTTVHVTITGTSFVSGATTVNVSGTGVTVSNVTVGTLLDRVADRVNHAMASVRALVGSGTAAATAAAATVVGNGTTVTADLVIASSATLGSHDLTVTTAGGTSTALAFTINAPVPLIGAFTATPSSIDFGSTAKLAWSGIANATSCTIDHGVGTVSCADGSASVTPLATTTYTLTATGTGGTATSTATVTLAAPVLGTFTASPTTIVAGSSITLSWTGINNATSCSITPAVGGVTCADGSTTASPTSTTTYTLTATGPSGSVTGTTTVTVTPASTLASVTPNQGAQTGTQSVTLVGTNFVSGATTVSVSGSGVTLSNVNVSSSTQITANFAVAAGAALAGRTVTVTTGGVTSASQTFTVLAAPTISTFSALATHLAAAQPARLRWTTSNAATCSIDNGVGTVTSCNDSVFVTPGTTKTYTLSATSAGASVSATFQLFANEPGRFVYWTSSGGSAGTHVHQYSMDATTGDLTAIGTGTVTSGNTPQGIAVDPAGKYAYVANNTSNTVSEYSIDATTGALTSRGTIPAGTGPRAVVVDPTGRFAYVVNNNSGGTGSISRYTIDATGLLVANGTTTLGSNSIDVTIDGTGRFLYATNENAHTIQEFSINADGTLTALGTVTTSGGFEAYNVAADPSGRFLYLTHHTDGRYSAYSIQSNGTLTLLGGGAVNIGSGTEDAVAVDPTGHFTYIVDFNNAILHEFSIDQSTGILSGITAPTLPHTLATTQTIVQFAIDPQGKFAYGTDSNNGQILLFTIGANGALAPVTSPLNTLAGGTSPFGIVVSP